MKLLDFEAGIEQPFFLIAGPCVIESESLALETAAYLQKITKTYHAWRGEAKDGNYQDELGFCKSATIDDIKANDFVLTPGRYVGVEEEEDDSEAFEVLMQDLTQTLFKQMGEAKQLDKDIKHNLKGLGYE